MTEHPYGYPVAIALISIALFFLVLAYKEFDDFLETRRNRRLNQEASAEIRKQLVEQAERP